MSTTWEVLAGGYHLSELSGRRVLADQGGDGSRGLQKPLSMAFTLQGATLQGATLQGTALVG